MRKVEQNIDEVLHKIANQAQEYFSSIPVIVLGSGASAAHGLPGMGRLAEYLITEITPNLQYKELWGKFVKLLNDGVDLESALQKTTLPEEITKEIIIKTWELINPKDIDVFKSIASNGDTLPLSILIKKIFSSTSSIVNIITTNYDRLAEYACDLSDYYHYSGFSNGFLRTQVAKEYIRTSRKVSIWKVHGSLDWFRNQNGHLIGLSNIESCPAMLIPEIVTPGIEKYSKTYHEPYRSIIQEADIALREASSYLCIGYGFNDMHIQEKLVNKCVQGDAKLLIITRSLTDATRKFITEQGCKNYLAFELDGANNTKIYSSLCSEPVVIPNANYWSIGGFLNLI